MAIADARGQLIAARNGGLKEGREQGIQEGREQGIQEGIRKQRLETAIRLLQNRYSPKEVSELTSIKIEELLHLKIPEET